MCQMTLKPFKTATVNEGHHVIFALTFFDYGYRYIFLSKYFVKSMETLSLKKKVSFTLGTLNWF